MYSENFTNQKLTFFLDMRVDSEIETNQRDRFDHIKFSKNVELLDITLKYM